MGSNLIPKAAPSGAPQPLRPQDIRYLVLEGGGGKGFAYLGAVQALERLGVMAQVKGYGGASAGAITALLLSMGMGSRDVETFLDGTDFGAFFDPPLPRRQPAAGIGVLPVEDTPAERRFIAQPTVASFLELFKTTNTANQPPAALGLIGRLLGVLPALLFPGAAGPRAALGSLGGVARAVALDQALDRLHRELAKHPPVGEVLWQGGRRFLAYLPRDLGLFSGEAARRVFNELLLERVGRKQKGRKLRVPGDTVTFAQHFQAFGTKLLVTGTNLRSGKTVLFSKDDTPHFPVADAVRISMGLPFIYKPYVIDDGGPQWAPCGLYVDGGVWNNLPYREFDSDAREDARRSHRAFVQSTLGLRLAIEPPTAIHSVADVALLMLGKGVMGTGESQVLDKHSAQTVLLDTRGLDLLNFTPDAATRGTVGKRARRQVLRYFGLGDLIDPADRDEQDDLQIHCLERAAADCSDMSYEECVNLARAAGLIS